MRPTALILAALLPGSTLSAQVSTEAPAGSWVFTPSFASQYMFRGARLGGPSLQPTLEYDRGPLAAGLWGSFPLRDHVADGSESEVDFYGTYRVDLGHGLALVPEIYLYTYPGATRADGYYPVTIEPSLGLECSVGPVQLTPKLYYDFMLKGPTAELTAALALPLPAAGTELDFTGTIGTFRLTDSIPDTTPAVKNWGDYWLVGVSAPFQLPNGAKLTVGWAYTAGSRNYLQQGNAAKAANPDAVGRGVLTISYAWSF